MILSILFEAFMKKIIENLGDEKPISRSDMPFVIINLTIPTAFPDFSFTGTRK